LADNALQPSPAAHAIRVGEHGGMQGKNTLRGLLWCAGWLLAVAPAMADVAPAMDKDDQAAAEERIEQQAKAERKACKAQKGKARDLCELQAKGRMKVALAKLEAQVEPSPEADRAVKEAQADLALRVAREQCPEAKGVPRDNCLKQARLQHESAIRRAKVEKVHALNELKAKAEKEARKTAAVNLR
jgi:hypothetical protein